MKLIMAIIRPSKVEEVKDALAKLNISGMTITEVRGHGRQKGHTAVYRGQEYSVTLLPKIKVEVVLPDDLVDDAIRTIIKTTRTVVDVDRRGWQVELPGQFIDQKDIEQVDDGLVDACGHGPRNGSNWASGLGRLGAAHKRCQDQAAAK